MAILNITSVVLDLLAWTALIRFLYCPEIRFDIKFWSYISLTVIIEEVVSSFV